MVAGLVMQGLLLLAAETVLLVGLLVESHAVLHREVDPEALGVHVSHKVWQVQWRLREGRVQEQPGSLPS